jgi:hypothetical protein
MAASIEEAISRRKEKQDAIKDGSKDESAQISVCVDDVVCIMCVFAIAYFSSLFSRLDFSATATWTTSSCSPSILFARYFQ